MEKEEFIHKTPHLYHLTDRRNLKLIKESQSLLSTVELVALSTIVDSATFLQSRRPLHSEVQIGTNKVYIRDQRPLNKALDKCLTNNWSPSDFILHLNKRVFMWPTIQRLEIHFGRYEHENPIILKFDTQLLLEINDNVEFSRINSGATRPSGRLGGRAAARGIDTFQTFDRYDNSVRSVAEVTFPDKCALPQEFHIGNSPYGPWRKERI